MRVRQNNLALLLSLCLGLPATSANGERPASQTSAPAGEEPENRQPDLPAERAAWNILFRRDAGGRALAENRLKALEEACNVPIDPSMLPGPPAGHTRSAGGPSVAATFAFPGTAWQSLGPQPIQSRTTIKRAFGDVAGRVDALAIHPTDSSTLILGSATGGIWKSTDAGATWRPVSDTAPTLATSSVAYAPSNPSIVYAATGEADNATLESVSGSLGTYLGAGLLKSVDGGETWIRIDSPGNLPSNAILSRVVVSPTDPQLVLVGVYRYLDIALRTGFVGGVARSTDGGVHFTRTFAHRISELLQDPSNGSRVYLAAANCSSGCQPSGVYVSTDFGQTWNPSLTPASPIATFTSPTGNIKLGATRSAGATVLFASVLDTKGQHAGGGIYRSADGGASWTKMSVDPTMCPAPPATNQCGYDHWITPADGSSSTVYFGSINLYKSTDGAATWSKLTDVYGPTLGLTTIHPDQHAGVPLPGSPSTLYFANDGGVYRTTDGGATFQNLNSTLTLAQLNVVALHPTDKNFAMGGTQDNASIRYTGSLVWTDRTLGDGGFNYIRADAPSQVLSAHYYAFLDVSNDGATTYTDVTPCDVLMDCFTSDKLEPMGFYIASTIAPAAPANVFVGTNRIWSNLTFGQDSGAWQPRSVNPITSGANDFLTAIATVGDGSGAFWAGSALGAVLFSTDGGATFASRSAGLPVSVVSKILPMTSDGRGAYITLGGFSGSPSAHVFRTTDAGQTWTNISGNLPDTPITTLVVDPTDPGDLFVGSDVGVFRSVNGGASWTSFNQGLPNVSVFDLKFHPATGDLWAATYGRGAFRVSNPAAPPFASFSYGPSNPAPGQAVEFTDASTSSPTSWSWSFGDGGTSTAQNPAHAYATSGIYAVTLTSTNAFGSGTTSLKLNVGAATIGALPGTARGHVSPVPRPGTLPPVSGRR